ncbi:MAG: hypothetical protein ACTSQJ_18795 [Promethearchaeota archaeon]
MSKNNQKKPKFKRLNKLELIGLILFLISFTLFFLLAIFYIFFYPFLSYLAIAFVPFAIGMITGLLLAICFSFIDIIHYDYDIELTKRKSILEIVLGIYTLIIGIFLIVSFILCIFLHMSCLGIISIIAICLILLGISHLIQGIRKFKWVKDNWDTSKPPENRKETEVIWKEQEGEI